VYLAGIYLVFISNKYVWIQKKHDCIEVEMPYNGRLSTLPAWVGSQRQFLNAFDSTFQSISDFRPLMKRFA
jgi:hypothetical protein